MATVSVHGAELFYTTRGSGPVCLVLCSIGTKPYELQMPSQLSDRLQLVFVDLRGGGRSTGVPSDLTFDVLASDLEAVRADLGVEQVSVLGHSILGALAIEYGRRCPASVSHVITVGTPPFGDMARVSARAASFFEEDAPEERKQVLRDNLARLPADASMGQIMFAHTPMRFFDARIDAAPLFAEASAKPELIAHLLGGSRRDGTSPPHRPRCACRSFSLMDAMTTWSRTSSGRTSRTGSPAPPSGSSSGAGISRFSRNRKSLPRP
ncbi:MAG: alpha/beta fold hydrolase [Thermoanaerobaculia bacterium]